MQNGYSLVQSLQKLTVNQLREKYQKLFGEPTGGRHKGWLIKRILWREQALAEGDLSERARRRAAELAGESDLRVTAPRGQSPEVEPEARPQRDARLPMPGTVITRPYKGRLVRVTVGDAGFEYEGTSYRSLSAVARAVTGSHCNGYLFFQLGSSGDER